jgi:exonuclease SbcC
VRFEAARQTAETQELAEASARQAMERALEEARRRRDAHGLGSRELHVRLTTAREAHAALPERMRARDALAATLAGGRFAMEMQAKVEEARGALAALGYDEEGHASLRARVRALAHADDAYRALVLAEQREEALAVQVEREQASLVEKAAGLAIAEGDLAAARDAIAAAEDVRPRLAESERALAEGREREAELLRRQGRTEEQREQLLVLRAKIEAALDEATALREEEEVQGDLSKAFGRDGVQAMLIDQALPEVEHVANEMLDHMTGGRIHVGLATRKENPKGALVETLDVRISDELGTRDYEMYSGGEAFRVDFALRIALARLLAARSGAELPTLIIDEGFGTQDAEGIDRLVEALNSIGSEFKLILVVTHVDELRGRFERRIEVTKDAIRGSFARVV